MSCEAELPGKRFNKESMQMIYTRYNTVSQYVDNKIILDVGCGAGIGLGYLVRKGAKCVIGLDFSEENIYIARDYYDNVEKINIILSDAHKLPFKNNSFDVISAMQVVQYLDAEKFLNECHRILKLGGVIIFSLSNKDRCDGFQGSQLSKNYFSAPDLDLLLTNHHFKSEFFGAFPITEKSKIGVEKDSEMKKIIELIPKTVRERIGDIIDHRDFILTNEIVDGMVEPSKLIPISNKNPDPRFKIIYVITHICEANKALDKGDSP